MSETMTIVEAAEEARQLAVEIIAARERAIKSLGDIEMRRSRSRVSPLRVRGSLEPLIGQAGEARAAGARGGHRVAQRG